MRHLKWKVCEPKMCIYSVQDCRSGHELNITVHEENNKRETYNYEAWCIVTQLQDCIWDEFGFLRIHTLTRQENQFWTTLRMELSLNIITCMLGILIFIFMVVRRKKTNVSLSSPNPLGGVFVLYNFHLFKPNSLYI